MSGFGLRDLGGLQRLRIEVKAEAEATRAAIAAAWSIRFTMQSCCCHIICQRFVRATGLRLLHLVCASALLFALESRLHVSLPLLMLELLSWL